MGFKRRTIIPQNLLKVHLIKSPFHTCKIVLFSATNFDFLNIRKIGFWNLDTLCFFFTTRKQDQWKAARAPQLFSVLLLKIVARLQCASCKFPQRPHTLLPRRKLFVHYRKAARAKTSPSILVMKRNMLLDSTAVAHHGTR